VRRAAGRLPAEEAPIRSAGEATRLAESHISRVGSRAAKVSSQRPFRSKAPGAFADPFTSSRERLAPDSISGIKLREAHGTSRANAVREPKICGFPQLALRASKQWHFPSAGTRYEDASLGVSLSQAKLRKAHGTSRANAVHGRRTQFPSARALDFQKWVFTGRREAAPSASAGNFQSEYHPATGCHRSAPAEACEPLASYAAAQGKPKGCQLCSAHKLPSNRMSTRRRSVLLHVLMARLHPYQ
jgi:hypothetical protein